MILVFDMRHGSKRRRLVVPVADYNVTGEEPYVDNALTAYGVTVEAIKDTTGTRVYDYGQNDDRAA